VQHLNARQVRLHCEPNTEGNRIAGTGQFTDIVFRHAPLVAALPAIEGQGCLDGRCCVDELQSNFAAAFIRPVVSAKANVPDSHGANESMLYAGGLWAHCREELILAKIAKFAFDLQALCTRMCDQRRNQQS
jgi:hypothetical protein